MKKITKTTFKSFIKKNEGNLYIKIESDFDVMQDMIDYSHDAQLRKLEKDIDAENNNNLGYKGVWLVGGSKNWFESYEDKSYVGYKYSNCCGSALVVIKK